MTMTDDAPAPTPVLDRLRADRDAARRELVELDGELEVLGRRGAAALEGREAAVLFGRRGALESEYAALDERVRGIEETRSAAEAAGRRIGALDVRIGREPDVYRRDDDERSFFADLWARDLQGSSEAAERLARHAAATMADLARRDLTTTTVGGLLPPVYLVDEHAALARAARPFADALQPRPLPPEGVSFTVPRITTGSAGAQTTEGAGWNEQDIAVTNATRTVELTSAQVDISRTLFERGGFGTDRLVMADLVGALEPALDASLLGGDGTSPAHLGVLNVVGINTVTYTDGSPTVAEAWPKFADAVQRVNSLRLMPATAVFMHPRRWAWITAAVDSTGRPLFNFGHEPPPNVVMALGDAAGYGQVVGQLMGLPVVTDANMPTNLGAGTNEDAIIFARLPDLRFYEDPLMQFTMEQALTTAPGQVRLAVGRFGLFIAGRHPEAISVIRGTGMAGPF